MKKQIAETAAHGVSRKAASIASAVRKAVGMTQVEFAGVLGVDDQVDPAAVKALSDAHYRPIQIKP